MMVVYQLIGFVGTVIVSLSYWQRTKKRILLFQVCSSLFIALHYALLSAFSGAAANVVQVAMLLLFYAREKKNWKASAIIPPFLLLSAAIAYLTYESPITVLPILGLLAGMLPFFQSNRTVIKVCGIVSALLWLVYTVVVRSYSGILTEIIIVVSTFISLFQKKE